LKHKGGAAAALFYISEILSEFDLIGLVEVRDDVSDVQWA
jgi:hypothetical protein